ncbi:methionine ABC transporter ATP-binding protein [Cardiobacteriaceae bacterium TAE3-ERU3]|nr:methionine ABC transporter ATP-binding protein [Cardiobacteriaceae bacterium TAE3-ERU3]
MIKLSNISKTYTHKGKTIHALRGVDLDVQAGQIYGVVGQSGAGKSTLIRCVNLLERPTTGSVFVDGKDLTAMNDRQLLKARHDIGMIFQHFNLLSSRTVFDNIALPLELIGTRRKVIKEKVKSLLALTGLEDKARHYPAQLSGGQKQRVAIARALASDPKVLLSDEATSALDPKTTESILELLRDINAKLGLTILMITHEMEVVKKICHRVALIEGGELVESNDVDAFFSNPQSELGQKFVAQIQQFDLPPLYANRVKPQGSHPLVKLAFHGDNIEKPLLSHLTRAFDLDVSIIQAKIEHIHTSNIGLLIVELEGTPEQNDAAIAYLREQPIELEVLGYVEPTL